MRKVVALAAVLLGACTHDIALMERGGGGQASGTAQSSGSGSGPITLTLDGKVYEGEWTLGSSGSSIAFGNSFGTVTSGAQVGVLQSFGTGMAIGGSSQGIALLRAADGSGLRCQFSYADDYGKGFGLCQDDAGKLYDMLIR